MHAILVYDDREYHAPGYVAVIVRHLSLHPQLQQKMCHSQLEDLLQLTGIENHAQYSNRCRRACSGVTGWDASVCHEPAGRSTTMPVDFTYSTHNSMHVSPASTSVPYVRVRPRRACVFQVGSIDIWDPDTVPAGRRTVKRSGRR